MALRISVVNQKGGVGKSTTVANLAVAFATRGQRVLVIDFDPQGTASQFLGLTHHTTGTGAFGAAEFTLGGGVFAPERNVVVEGIDVLPATMELAYLEQSLLGDVVAGTRRLRAALDAVASNYDVVLIDCPPTIGLLALNAMVASPNVLVPVKLAHASIPGALRLQKNIEALRQRIEPGLRVLGVIGTFYTDAARKPAELLATLRRLFGALVFDTCIHQSKAVEDAAEWGRPVVSLHPRARGARQYHQLCEEVLSRVEKDR